MSNNTNKTNVPEAKEAMDRFKMEVASELGVPLSNGYNGNLTSAQNGSVGGYMVIPPARENKVLRMVILVSMALSFLFTQIPVLRDISSGFKIIILTFIVAGSAAVLFPVKEEE